MPWLNSPRCCLARSARWIASPSRPGICGHIVRSPEWASSPPLLRHLHRRLPVLESIALLIFEVKGPTLPLSSPSPPPLLLLLLSAVVVRLARGVAVWGALWDLGGPHPSPFSPFMATASRLEEMRRRRRARSTTNMKCHPPSAPICLSAVSARTCMKSATVWHPKYHLQHSCVLFLGSALRTEN